MRSRSVLTKTCFACRHPQATLHVYVSCLCATVLCPECCMCSFVSNLMKGKLKNEGSNGSSTGRKKYYNKRSGVNSAFKKLGLQYSGVTSSSKKRRTQSALRSLAQISFPEVAQWPEKKCLAELQKLGVLGSRRGRQCWACCAPMRSTPRWDTLRCSNRQCPRKQPRFLAYCCCSRFGSRT